MSIVTPVLNRADTIEDVLTSVAAQTYGSIEHIIVDGGSTDRTVEVVEAFAHSSRFPIRWVSETDTGMYDAINKGLRIANGDVLAYINSDDLYFPWSVESAVVALQRGCDFAFGDVAIINTTGGRTSFRLQFYRRFDPRYSVHHMRLAQATLFWTREAMETIGPFNPDLRYLGDVEYWARGGVAGSKFCRLDEVLALVTEHPGTLSVQHADDARRELESIQRSLSDQLGMPTHERSRKWAEALRWRWQQRAFRAQAKREHPTRWPRFIAMLKDLDVAVGGSGPLVFLLPAALLRKRPQLRRWLSAPERFEDRYLAWMRALAHTARSDAVANGVAERPSGVDGT